MPYSQSWKEVMIQANFQIQNVIKYFQMMQDISVDLLLSKISKYEECWIYLNPQKYDFRIIHIQEAYYVKWCRICKM